MKETLVEICTLLNKHEVDYLLIGGVAVVFMVTRGAQPILIFGITQP
jgi:hypothetical protein